MTPSLSARPIVAVFIATWALAVMVPLGLAVQRAFTDDDVPFLADPEGGAWVVVDRPFQANPRREGDYAVFVRQFALTSRAGVAVQVSALGRHKILLDGVERAERDGSNWRKGEGLDLGVIEAGDHELAVQVWNPRGPAAVVVSHPTLSTPAGWGAASAGADELIAVRLAAARALPAISFKFPSLTESLAARWPVLLAIAAGVLFGHAVMRRRAKPAADVASLDRPVAVGVAGCILVLGLFALGAPRWLGFDGVAQLDHVAFIVERRTLPTANDGWQMFQPPLFYLLAAPLLTLGRLLGGDADVALVRLIPLLCGVALVFVVSRTLNGAATPWARQRAVVVCGLLPMSMAVCRFVGNEPLAGLLTACIVALSVAALREGRLPSIKEAALLGLLLGLAALTKVSVLVIVPAVAAALVACDRAASWRASLSRLAVVAAVAGAVAGWWFVRNIILLGRPFVGGWDPSRSLAWWQDPGVRTLADFTTFGASLARPVFSGVVSVWDGLYSTFWADGFLSGRASLESSPRWDYDSLAASALFSIPLTLTLVVGVLVVVARRPRVGLFALGTVVAWIGAIMSLAITLPIFSTAKSSYMLGVVPCFAILLAAGLEVVGRGRALRVAVDVVIASWAVLVLLAFGP